MSRFYKIVVGAETAAPAGQQSASNNAGATWTNQLPSGRADLGAQRIEWDIWSYNYDAPISQSSVKIWGPTKAQISQAKDFNGAKITVYGGMQSGLPLASAAVSSGQQGILIQGQVFQAFGNWQGLNQSLDFVITADNGITQSNPGNFVFAWFAGQSLSQALQSTLAIAYPPPFKININISSNLIRTQTQSGTFATLQQFASYIKDISRQTLTGDPTYQGVSITNNGNILNVYDGAGPQPLSIINIQEQDLIGSVTWLDIATIQFTTVMRADISVGTQVTLPYIAGLQAITSANSFSSVRAQGTFSGAWTVTAVRHVGDSRAAGAQSWVSTFQAITNTALASTTSVSDSSA